MFLFTWLCKLYRPLEKAASSPVYSFLNEEGVVVDTIPPGGKGKVRLCGVYWSAKTDGSSQWPVFANTVVSIKERVGLVLIVEPFPVDNSAPLGTVTPLRAKLRKPTEEDVDIAA